MKYLIVLVVVLLLLWLAKSARGKVKGPAKGDDLPRRPQESPERPPEDGQVMLACAHCGLHLPGNEALPGRGGVYCSEAHRAIVEARDEAP